MSGRSGSAGVATAASFAVGALVALQARANSDLAVRLGGGFSGGAQAALVNFVVGGMVVSAWVLAVPAQRRALVALRASIAGGALTWWRCLAGVGAAFLILTQTGTVPTLGVAVFTVAVVGGQTIGSLVVDHTGIAPAGRQPLSARRVLASAAAVAAVVVAVSGRLGSAGFSLPLVGMCLAAGVAVAVQSALNGGVASAVDSAVAAAWLNFAVGAAALVVVVAALAGAGHGVPALPTRWWLYSGGPMGLAFVAVVAAAVRVVGVLLVSLATVAGQVVGAVLLDAFAPVAGQAVRPLTVVGAAATVVAVVVAVRSGPRAGAATRRRR